MEKATHAAQIEAAVRAAFRQYGAAGAAREAFFFDAEAWREQEETFFDEAVLVMTVDGLAYDLFQDEDFCELLSTLIEPLGVYFDFEEPWQIGFIEN